MARDGQAGRERAPAEWLPPESETVYEVARAAGIGAGTPAQTLTAQNGVSQQTTALTRTDPDATAVTPRDRRGAGKLHYTVQCCHDVDAQALSLSDWTQQYDQLSQGRFRGALRELLIDEPRIQVFHEYTLQQTIQRCLPLRGSVWFGIPAGGCSMSELRFCGRPQPHAAHPLFSVRSGEEFSLRTPQNFGIYGVVFDEDWLRQRLAHLGANAAADAPFLRASLQATLLQPQTHRALCATIESVLGLGAAGDAEPSAGCAATQALLDRLLQLLCNTRQDDYALDRAQATQRRQQVVMDARALVLLPGNRDLTVNDLCARLHVTQRTLQNHFRGAVGESPLDFLKAVRLNACRRALQVPGISATVQDVAGQWGFSHMGHFSQAYKTMFGELPSTTLREAQVVSAYPRGFQDRQRQHERTV